MAADALAFFVAGVCPLMPNSEPNFLLVLRALQVRFFRRGSDSILRLAPQQHIARFCRRCWLALRCVGLLLFGVPLVGQLSFHLNGGLEVFGDDSCAMAACSKILFEGLSF